MPHDNVPQVYAAINAVTAALSVEGISKDRKNQQQGYSFRGIDDVYNELSPILAKHKLCILPRVLAREVVERQTKSGGALFYVTVDVEFDLISVEDGSKHTIRTFGEAMDSADKATNKAMSAAYKYAAMQAFCIPTEGDNDADAVTHEVVARVPSGDPVKPRSKANAREVDGAMRAEIDACQTLSDLGLLWASKAFQAEFKQHPADWQAMLIEHKDARKAELQAIEDARFPGDVKPNFDRLEA